MSGSFTYCNFFSLRLCFALLLVAWPAACSGAASAPETCQAAHGHGCESPEQQSHSLLQARLDRQHMTVQLEEQGSPVLPPPAVDNGTNGSAHISLVPVLPPPVVSNDSANGSAMAGARAPVAMVQNQRTIAAEAGNPDQTVPQEMEHFKLLNDLRAAGYTCPDGTSFGPNAVPLVFDCRLWEASFPHSGDMADNNYFSHTSQDGRSPWDRAEAAGISANGENIAAGSNSAAGALEQWKNSNGHCLNMMNPSFRMFAVGYAQGGQYGHYWTQMFKSDLVAEDDSCYAASAPSPTPDPVPIEDYAVKAYCIQVLTGNENSNDGYISVLIKSESGDTLLEKANTFYGEGDVVVDECFASPVKELQVQNDNNDAWTGSFRFGYFGYSEDISWDWMKCSSCSPSGSTEKVVFDGNGDEAGQAPVQCLNGAVCSIVPELPSTCLPKCTSDSDAGYTDNYRGWYDVQGCGHCLDYCRWTGHMGSGGNPASKTVHKHWCPYASTSSHWSCRLAGTSDAYTGSGHFGSTFSYKKCAGEGAVAPSPNDPPAPTPAPCPSFESKSMYEPLDMSGQGRTTESSASDCARRCAGVSGCAHFSWWGDGGCHIQDSSANKGWSCQSTAGPPC